MIGTKLLIDTNIAIYLFNGDRNLGRILEGAEVYLSFISELELMAFKQISREELHWAELFVSECNSLDVNLGIKEIAKGLLRRYTVKVPDAIIAASAIFLGLPLLSADRHFAVIDELTFVLYEP